MNQKKVTIVDYGMGNILSISRAFEFLGARVDLTDAAEKVQKANYLILPGVGAFGDGMKELEQRHLVSVIQSYIQGNRPFLGICLGMQMMLEASHEFGYYRGLGMMSGEVLPLPALCSDGTGNKIPHISWNQIYPFDKNQDSWSSTIIQTVKPGSYFYFLHSFYTQPKDQANILAVTPFYDFNFPSIIRRGNIYGVQFHPEKSGLVGLSVLKNFLSL